MDIYFQPEYGKLSEIIDDGVSECFEYQDENGKIRNIFIKRKIPFLVDGVQYYDISTPYGYGGPFIISGEKEHSAELIDAYGRAFEQYCLQNNIVSEFVRFHPLYSNALDFEEIYHSESIRKTLGTCLTIEDPVQDEFSKGCRKNIRRALNAGVSYRVTPSPGSIDQFIEIYYSTMKRDNAAEFYYFDKKYFDELLRVFRKELVLVEAIYEEKTIAANLCFVSDGNIHIHLSGTLSEYLYLSPAYILRYAITVWGKENGLKQIHHGGGVTNSADDSLFKFKKQFASNLEFEYYIGKMIRNKDVYDKLCQMTGNVQSADFFPAYRKR